jgi:hypothetical protein
MKVQHAIDMLTKYYNPTDEIAIDWADMEQFNGDNEMTDEIWEDALNLIERGDSVIDIQWVEHCVYTAQEEAK